MPRYKVVFKYKLLRELEIDADDAESAYDTALNHASDVSICGACKSSHNLELIEDPLGVEILDSDSNLIIARNI